MANTVFSDIQNGLETHLLACPSVPTTIVWENTIYTPVPDVAFLRAMTQHAPTTQTSIGNDGLNTQSGIFLINSFYGRGDGRGIQNTFLSELVDHFKRGTTIVENGVSIRIEAVTPQPSIDEDDWFNVPIQVRYIAYTTN